jgi:hypothetical protein
MVTDVMQMDFQFDLDDHTGQSMLEQVEDQEKLPVVSDSGDDQCEFDFLEVVEQPPYLQHQHQFQDQLSRFMEAGSSPTTRYFDNNLF